MHSINSCWKITLVRDICFQSFVCKFLIDYAFSFLIGIPTNSVEKYKITPCDSANAFGGNIPNNIGTNSATNGSKQILINWPKTYRQYAESEFFTFLYSIVVTQIHSDVKDSKMQIILDQLVKESNKNLVEVSFFTVPTI